MKLKQRRTTESSGSHRSGLVVRSLRHAREERSEGKTQTARHPVPELQTLASSIHNVVHTSSSRCHDLFANERCLTAISR